MTTICPACQLELRESGLERNLQVCYACGAHLRIGARTRLSQLADEGQWAELFGDVAATVDPLEFVDTLPYTERLLQMRRRTGLEEAVVCADMKIMDRPVVVGAFDFGFLGGSMGIVAGEKVALVLDEAAARDLPALLCCASGGARMQEGSLSLGQMAKTIVALESARAQGVPVIVLLTDPTMGGVMASFAALGDVIFAEPLATVGFAGKRVIYQATYEDLPADFQTSEYFHERGFIDQVVPRGDLREVIGGWLEVYAGRNRWEVGA